MEICMFFFMVFYFFFLQFVLFILVCFKRGITGSLFVRRFFSIVSMVLIFLFFFKCFCIFPLFSRVLLGCPQVFFLQYIIF